MNPHKLFPKALNGPKNLPFHDFLQLARAFGFQLARTNGSHHILIHDDVREPLNLQEVEGKAKPYQVRQFLRIVEDNDLTLGNEP
jgi:HicA toxin of bacterial toxin-antitoxin,